MYGRTIQYQEQLLRRFQFELQLTLVYFLIATSSRCNDAPFF